MTIFLKESIGLIKYNFKNTHTHTHIYICINIYILARLVSTVWPFCPGTRIRCSLVRWWPVRERPLGARKAQSSVCKPFCDTQLERRIAIVRRTTVLKSDEHTQIRKKPTTRQSSPTIVRRTTNTTKMLFHLPMKVRNVLL